MARHDANLSQWFRLRAISFRFRFPGAYLRTAHATVMASFPRHEPQGTSFSGSSLSGSSFSGSNTSLERTLTAALRATLAAQPEDPVRFFATTLLRGPVSATGCVVKGDDASPTDTAAYRAATLPKLEAALNRAVRGCVPAADLAAGAVPAASLVAGRMLRQLLGPDFRVTDLFK